MKKTLVLVVLFVATIAAALSYMYMRDGEAENAPYSIDGMIRFAEPERAEPRQSPRGCHRNRHKIFAGVFNTFSNF